MNSTNFVRGIFRSIGILQSFRFESAKWDFAWYNSWPGHWKGCRLPSMKLLAIWEHWLQIYSPLERIMREINCITRIVSSLPDGNPAVMLSASRLRYIISTKWSTRKYLNMDLLKEVKLYV